MIEKFSKEYIDFLEKNKLLPLKETAKILNLHPATLRSLAKSGVIKYNVLGRKIYFNLEDIKNNSYVKQETPDYFIISNGYVKINVGKDFPSADDNGYVALHRLIMEAKILRRLNKKEVIVFKDNNNYNNKINNLEIQRND